MLKKIKKKEFWSIYLQSSSKWEFGMPTSKLKNQKNMSVNAKKLRRKTFEVGWTYQVHFPNLRNAETCPFVHKEHQPGDLNKIKELLVNNS